MSMKAITAAAAQEKIKEAEQALAKRSFFKASPDYYTAESKFKQAALDFKVIKDFPNAINALIRASDCAEHNRDKFTAASHLEAAATLAHTHRDSVNGLKEKALELFERTCVLYNESGNATEAIEIKFRIAKSIHQAEPQQGAKFLLQACELIDPARNDQSVATDVFSLAINVFVRVGQLATALAQVRRYSDLCRRVGQRDQLFKNNLTQTILMCALGDFAGANEAFMDHVQDDDYLPSVEAEAAEDLIEAFTKHDALKLKKVQAGRGFKFLFNEVAKFAGALTMNELPPGPGGGTVVEPPAARPITQHGQLQEFTSQQCCEEEEEEEEKGQVPALPVAAPAPSPLPSPSPAPAPAPSPAAAEDHDSDDDIFA
jgi:hypothetical protein